MTREEYDRLINNKWRDAKLEIPSMEVAIRGARAIYRKAMGTAWKGKVIPAPRQNSYTWIRRGVMTVNPNRPARSAGGSGWPDITHCLAHYAHQQLRPKDKPHSEAQAILETELTNYVLSDAFAKYRG